MNDRTATELSASPLVLAKVKARLTQRLEEIARASEATTQNREPVELDQQSVGRIARIDLMQVQAMAFASEARRVAEVRRITAALGRLEAGEFGFCLSCGEEIAPARLALDPTLPNCLECARQGSGRG